MSDDQPSTSQEWNVFLGNVNSSVTTLYRVNPRFVLGNFQFLLPKAFTNINKESIDDRNTTESRMKSDICSVKTRADAMGVCDQDGDCARRLVSLSGMCKNESDMERLVSLFMVTRGITPADRQQPSSVLDTNSKNAEYQKLAAGKMLEAVVHEGIHRLRGKIWAARVRLGMYYTHSVSKERLSCISQTLDEGTTQIMTIAVIDKLKQVPGKTYFKDYRTDSYSGYVKKVNDMLRIKGKQPDFLTAAYLSDTDERAVEDLQLWQP